MGDDGIDNTEIVNLLLEYGANPNIVDETGWTPIHAASHFHPEAIPLLLDYGANPNVYTKNGDTVLHLFSSSHSVSDTKIFKLLLENIDNKLCYSKNNDGNTPLTELAISGSTKCIILLLNKCNYSKNEMKLLHEILINKLSKIKNYNTEWSIQIQKDILKFLHMEFMLQNSRL